MVDDLCVRLSGDEKERKGAGGSEEDVKWS